jgi:hypothetical protein
MRLRRTLAGACAVALLAGAAAARDRDDRKGPPHGPGWADPGDVISAEIAFARLAREKGQWTAFRATAARGAQQFAPGPVRAADFLKGRKDPAVAAQWQPHAVWIACDGSYAVTRGAWQDGKQAGWFMTVWQRQERGDYRWVLDQGGDLAQPLAAPDFLTAKVAECPARRRDDGKGKPAPAPASAPAPADWLSGRSADGTLRWTTRLGADGMRTGARQFAVTMQVDGAMAEVARAETGGS